MKLIVGIILLALLFLFPLLHQGFYESHDGEAHVARFAAYYQAFQDGDIPPRWAGNLNFGYGTPIFIFYYPLPGYIASFVHVFGLGFENIFKLLMGISFIVAPIGFYLWMRLLFKKEVALLGALLFGLAPYHILDLYVRGDVAEMIAFVFVPFVFWAIEKTLITKKILFVLLGSVFYGALILSHNGVSLMFSPVFLLYGLIRSQKKEQVLKIIVLLGTGLLLSAFFWIPALYEGKYVNAKLFIGTMYKDHFPSFLQLFYSPWGFGPDVQKIGGLSPQIGILAMILVSVSMYLFFKEKKEKKFLGMWLFVFISALFLTLPISDFFWSNLATLRLYEFPWRFIGLASFVAAVLGCFVLDKVKDKKLFVILFLILIITSLPFVKVKKYITKSDHYYQFYTGTTDYHGAASSIWTAGNPGTIAQKQIEIIGGKGEVLGINKKNATHLFKTNAKDVLSLVDNTHYFPGWKVSIDGQKVPIQFQDPNHRGLITFQVPQGTHSVAVAFTGSPIRKIADYISLGACMLLLVSFAATVFYNKRIKHS